MPELQTVRIDEVDQSILRVTLDRPDRLNVQHHIASLIPKLRSLRVPVIAAVNGAAAGGGLALALGSEIRIVGEAISAFLGKRPAEYRNQ